MPTMNETSTITLPEYHNLLALLLLSLNTPSVSSSSTTQEELKKKRKKRDNAHTESGARQQNGAGRQVPDPDKETDLTHKIHHQKKKQVLHQKRKTDKTVYHHEHANTNHVHERGITHQRKKKKEKPHDTFPRSPTTWHTDPQSNPQRHTLNLPLTPTHTPCLHPCYHPFLHPTRILPTRLPTLSYTPTPTLLPFPATYRLLPLYHHPCLHSCPQLYPFLSRSRYRSPSTCAPLPDGRYGPPPPGYHCLPVPLPGPLLSAILFTCLSALLCSPCYHHAATLCSGPVLTTLHHSHLLCVTPVTCATTSPLRESTHTPCRFHHPYRSLTLAHRVVPPLVVPVPSLAVSGVRLSFMVPLVGESPLADARLPPHPNGHLLLAKRSPTLPSIHTLLLPAPLLYAYMLTFFPALLLTYLPSFLSTSLLATFIQPCQHNAASIVHQIRQSPQPPVQHICTHKGGAVCERQRVPSPRVHICSVDMMPELRLSERQRARPSPARARLVTSGPFD